MIATITPKFAKLPPRQKRLWPALRPSVGLGFVLYGGTAISLQLGHRRSVDFDFFHDQPLDRDRIRAAFPFMERATVVQDAVDTLSVLAPAAPSAGGGGVKVSFFGGLKFGRVGEPSLTCDGVVEVASLDDLMAHKLRVILLRPEKKDYEDIAAMIRAGRSMAQGLAGCPRNVRKVVSAGGCAESCSLFRGWRSWGATAHRPRDVDCSGECSRRPALRQDALAKPRSSYQPPGSKPAPSMSAATSLALYRAIMRLVPARVRRTRA